MIREVRSRLQRKYPGTRINVRAAPRSRVHQRQAAATTTAGAETTTATVCRCSSRGPISTNCRSTCRRSWKSSATVQGVVDVGTNFELSQPELRVNVDRVRAADLGVSIDSLAANLRTLVGGEDVTTIKQGDNQYNVQLRLDEQFRDQPEKLGNLLIPRLLARSASATWRNCRWATDRRTFSGSTVSGRSRCMRAWTAFLLVKASPVVREKIAELNLKPGYGVVFTGNAKTLDTASKDFTVAMLLAVAFIYMVLASQFNSLIHPLTIMTALPLSLPAGLLALLAFGMTLNVYSAIGMLMLFGIVKKNSILQVDYTNTLRAEGMERHEALIVANRVRLRPILMTTISIVAGMLPIALGRGAGAGSRASMAVTIIGGQMLCLLLTLLITPVVYSYFDDLAEFRFSRLLNRMRRRHPDPEAAGD